MTLHEHLHDNSFGLQPQEAPAVSTSPFKQFDDMASRAFGGVTCTLRHLYNELWHQTPSQHCESPMFPLA